MQLMLTLLSLLFIIFLALALVGLVKPGLIKQKSRMKAFFWNIGGAFIVLVIIGSLAPTEQNAANKSTEQVNKEELLDASNESNSANGMALNSASYPAHFDTVEEMISEFNDYPPDVGQFKVIKKDPLHIQLSPLVTPEDYPEVIEDQVRRALIYGIYRPFIHTSVPRIRVTAIPMIINFQNGNKRYLEGYKRTISLDREKALSVIKKYLHVSSFSDLVTEKKVDDMVFHDQWIGEFGRLYYNDQGYPGIKRFVGELAKLSDNS